MPEATGGTAALAAPVGAAALVGAAAHGPAASDGWERTLDELEERLAAWWGALRGTRPWPTAYTAPPPSGPLPAHLQARARAIAAGQRDVEEEIRARRAALGALLRGIGTTHRRLPIPVFVDDRA